MLEATDRMGISRKSDLVQTLARIRPHVHRTPVMTSSTLNSDCGCEIFFKCENFQRAGSFKIRGATNAIMSMSDSQRERGIVAHSSGNHAQAIALAARSAGVKACIAMPENAPTVKVAATEAYGGEVVFCESTAQAREDLADKIIDERGSTFVHPSNNLDVILGQGTAAMELFEEVSDIDFLLTPVGGGGLLAGSSLAACYFGNQCQTVGAEPQGADDAFRSLQSGKIESNESVDTICDGLRTFLGDINFPIIQQHVNHIITVSDEEIIDAMRLIWHRMKIVIEPSCAVPLAALKRNKPTFAKRKIGVILTGGNVDLQALPFNR